MWILIATHCSIPLSVCTGLHPVFAPTEPLVTHRLEHSYLGGEAPRIDNIRPILRLLQRLVLARGPPARGHSENNDSSAAGDDDTAASLIAWLLRPKEEIRREPMADAAEAEPGHHRIDAYKNSPV